MHHYLIHSSSRKGTVDAIRTSLEFGACVMASTILNNKIENSMFMNLLTLSSTLMDVDFSLDEQYSGGLKIIAENKGESQVWMISNWFEVSNRH